MVVINITKEEAANARPHTQKASLRPSPQLSLRPHHDRDRIPETQGERRACRGSATQKSCPELRTVSLCIPPRHFYWRQCDQAADSYVRMQSLTMQDFRSIKGTGLLTIRKRLSSPPTLIRSETCIANTVCRALHRGKAVVTWLVHFSARVKRKKQHTAAGHPL